jgi:hypothetical protein
MFFEEFSIYISACKADSEITKFYKIYKMWLKPGSEWIFWATRIVLNTICSESVRISKPLDKTSWFPIQILIWEIFPIVWQALN